MEQRNLKTMIEASGLSQSAFGKVYGYSVFQISNYLMGRSEVPRDLVNKLASAIEVTPEDFCKKDLTKTIKNMVIVIKDGPEENAALAAKDAVIRQQQELIDSLKALVDAQRQLLEVK
jgi:transcriptional regulator with XRE-family HTH domain